MADVQDYKAGSSSSTAQAAAASAEEQRFQIAPAPQNMFQPTKVKALVEELLKAELADVAYDGSESTKLSTELANKIRAKLKGGLSAPYTSHPHSSRVLSLLIPAHLPHSRPPSLQSYSWRGTS